MNWYGFKFGMDYNIHWIKANTEDEAIMLAHKFFNSNWAISMFDRGRVKLVKSAGKCVDKVIY